MNSEADIVRSLRLVLKEAESDTNPLVDRLRWLSGIGPAVDRFFAKLKFPAESPFAGHDRGHSLFPAEVEGLRDAIMQIVEQAVRCFHGSIKPAIERQGICIRRFEELSTLQQRRANKFFRETTLPVLTPLGFDPGRPFPQISNFSVNLAVWVRDHQGRKRFARIKVPEEMPQLLRLDRAPGAARGAATLLWLEDLITVNLAQLFPGLRVAGAHPFRIIRSQQEEREAPDGSRRIRQLGKRLGRVVHLQVERGMPDAMLRILTQNLQVPAGSVCRMDGLVSLSRLSQVAAIALPASKDSSREKTASLRHPELAGWEGSLSA